MTRRVCSRRSCDRPVKGRGLCNRHYQQWRKAHPDAAPLSTNAGRWGTDNPPPPYNGARNTGRTRFKPGIVPWNKGMGGTAICEVCGALMTEVRPSRPRRFCSQVCHGAWRRGPNHPMWNGYRDEAEQVRGSVAYQEWRWAVYCRDNFTCQHCGARGVRLEADHIKSFATHPELRLAVANGRTLCVPCHRATPTYGKRVR